jgi:hypothetical protein
MSSLRHRTASWKAGTFPRPSNKAAEDTSMKIVFVDIDHSLSDAAWRDPMIDHYTWDEYHIASADDKPNREVIEVINSLHADQWLVIGLTARPSKFRGMTVAWCVSAHAQIDELIMRPDDNFEKSPDFKIAAVRARIKELDGVWSPIVVFDDRDDVIAAIRAERITAFQVYAGGGVPYG